MSKDTNKNSLNAILEDIDKTLEKLNKFIIDKEAENDSILKECLIAEYTDCEIDMLGNKFYDNSDVIAAATQDFNSIREILGGNYE